MLIVYEFLSPEDTDTSPSLPSNETLDFTLLAAAAVQFEI